MTKIVVISDVRSLNSFQQALDVLGYVKVRTIMHYALDQAGHKAAGEIKKLLVTQSGLSKQTVTSEITEIKSSVGNLEYVIRGEGHRWGLNKFSPQQTEAGAWAMPWNTPRTFPHTFVVAQYGYQVFKRTSGARGPIKMLYGPAVFREMERGMIPVAFDTMARNDVVNAVDLKLRQFMP